MKALAMVLVIVAILATAARWSGSSSAQSTPKSLTVYRTNYVLSWSWRAGEYGANDVLVSNQFMTVIAREDVAISITNEFHNVITFAISQPIYPWDAAQKFFTFHEGTNP